MITPTRDQFRLCAHRNRFGLRCLRFTAFDHYCVAHTPHPRKGS